MAIYEMYRPDDYLAATLWLNELTPGRLLDANLDFSSIISTNSTSANANETWTDPDPEIGNGFDDLFKVTCLPKLSEWHIYGSESHGRFCVRKPERNIYYTGLQDEVYNKQKSRYVSFKNYELKDHLGNVRLTFNDVKKSGHWFRPVPGTCGVPATANDFVLNVKSVNNYYPFGMLQPGYSYSSESHRFGFNGMEKDDEIKGTGNSYTTEFRGYDSRLGMWLSKDPVFKSWESPYAGFGNNPIMFIDPFGNDYEESKTSSGSLEGEQRTATMRVSSTYKGETIEGGTYSKNLDEYWHIGENGKGQWLGGDKYSEMLQPLAKHFFDNEFDIIKYGFREDVNYSNIFSTMLSNEIAGYWKNRTPWLPNGLDNPWYNEGLISNDLDLVTTVGLAKLGFTIGTSLIIKSTANELKKLPIQLHHFATNKNKLYSDKMSDIAKQFGLDLNGSWNKAFLPQLGRHPNKYHDFVLKGMRNAANMSGGSQAKFLKLFEKNVIRPVMKNPNMLNKSGW